MLKCHEIFERCSPELVNDIFVYLFDKEKAVYKAAIQNIAAQRKLRPVFVARKPKLERHQWLKQALSRKPADDFAIQILQIWLLGAHRDLICEFLDGLHLPHDGKGVVESLPAEPAREQLEKAIDGLLARHPAEVVSVYLHAFQAMDDHGWKTLDDLLQQDDRLALGRPQAAAPAGPAPEATT